MDMEILFLSVTGWVVAIVMIGILIAHVVYRINSDQEAELLDDIEKADNDLDRLMARRRYDSFMAIHHPDTAVRRAR